MDKRLALRMLNLIEHLNIENLALRSLLLEPYGRLNTEQVENLLREVQEHSGVRDTVRERWKQLRQQLESDSNLEEAIEKFLQITPPAKDVN